MEPDPEGGPGRAPWALCHVPGDEGLDGSVYAAVRLDAPTLASIEAEFALFAAAKAAFPEMSYADVFDCTPEWFEVGATADHDYDGEDAARYQALLDARDDAMGDPGLVAALPELADAGGWAIVPAGWLPSEGNLRTEMNLRRFCKVGPPEDPAFAAEVGWSAYVKHTEIRLETPRATLADVATWRAAARESTPTETTP